MQTVILAIKAFSTIERFCKYGGIGRKCITLCLISLVDGPISIALLWYPENLAALEMIIFLLFKRSFWQRLQTFSLFNFQGCNFIRLFLFSKELWNTGRVSWQTMHLMTQCLLSPSKNIFTEFPTAGLSCIAVISMGVEDGLSFFSVFVLH